MPVSYNTNSKKMFGTIDMPKPKNWKMVSFIVLCCIALYAYFYLYKNNKEQFEDGDGASDSAAPNLNVDNGEVVVALFYADWCPHCVDFKPDYKRAMSTLNGNTYKNKRLRFEMVDCEKYKPLSKKYGVSGFPTVKILKSNSTTDVEEYSGDRSYKGLSTYFV